MTRKKTLAICLMRTSIIVLLMIVSFIVGARSVEPEVKEIVAQEPAPEPKIVTRIKYVDVPYEPVVKETTYTDEDLFLMACAIYVEAGGNAASDETRLMVGSVILNRLENGYWGDTLREVLEAPGQYNTFSSTGVVFPARAYNKVEQEAVARSYRIAQQVLDEGPICPPEVIWQAGFEQGKGTYLYQDGLYFCYS